MNYYQRIQNSIDYIETNLESKINLALAAKEAFMSLSSFYRMFFALAGYSVKDYVRRRRISLAAYEILNSGINIIDIAMKYDYDSGDSFSRAFKKITGFLPSEFRKNKNIYSFERMDIMDKYFNVEDTELVEKYPEIKVLKSLENQRVAYYCYFGKAPEDHAFAVMGAWLSKSKLNLKEQKLRIFGYNNPSPASDEQDEYGYEVCITIGDDVIINDPKVSVKILEGGLYAVTGVRPGENGDLGLEIMKAWKRFNDWLKDSKYTNGEHQWLEEHLGFDEYFKQVSEVDLYMPVKLKI